MKKKIQLSINIVYLKYVVDIFWKNFKDERKGNEKQLNGGNEEENECYFQLAINIGVFFANTSCKLLEGIKMI